MRRNFSDKKGKFLSKHSKITLKLFLEKWMIAIALFYFSKLFQPSCEAVSNISLLKFLPQQGLRGYFILTEGEVSFKLLKKTSRLKMSEFLFFIFSNISSLKFISKNKTKTSCVLQIWVKIKLITWIIRALGMSSLVLKILRE